MRWMWICLAFAACDPVSVVITDSETDTDTEQGEGGEEEVPTCDVIDCTNPACAEEFECTWPTEMVHESTVTFSGQEIACRVPPLPLDIPVDIPDCGSQVRAHLMERTEGDLCPMCDRTFEAPLQIVDDTCSELLGEEPPTEGAWGFRFIDETTREVYLPDTEGVWTKGADLVLDGRAWRTATNQPVELEPPDCNNGVQRIGTLDVQGSYRDGGPPE